MDVEEKIKLFNRKEEELEELRKKLQRNPQYLGELKQHPLYNMWRSFRFTDNGKKIGNDKRWDSFLNFYTDVIDNYEECKRLCRRDRNKNWNKNNYIFLTYEELGLLHKKDHYLVFNNEEKSLKEWAIELDIPYNVVKQRYYASKKNNKGVDWILNTNPEYNRKWSKNKKKDVDRFRATRLVSNYNHKDKRKGFQKGDLTVDWVISTLKDAKCTYCGDTVRIGLDRVDNSKGHVKSNVVPCCYDCNVARSDNFSHKEMLILGEAIRNIKDKRNLN